MLKLMYITNDPEVASIADGAGVDRIFIDLEQYGKEKRQKNWDSVKSKHSISDIPKVKAAVKNAQMFVRTDPIFDGFSDELEGVLACEPDVVMLPYFKTVREVETFIKAVDGRATTSLLLETREAAEQIDDIISVGGIDEIHIGLNDLSHSYGKKFLFEELADGTVDRLVERFKADGIKNYGFGGIASLGSGLLPAEMIIPEHYRLGSNCAILSRAFCDVSKVGDIDEIRRVFDEGVSAIRDYEKKCAAMSEQELSENSAALKQRVEEIVSNMQQ